MHFYFHKTFINSFCRIYKPFEIWGHGQILYYKKYSHTHVIIQICVLICHKTHTHTHTHTHIYMVQNWFFLASLLQPSVSHDPSEIVCCSRNFSYYYQCWKQLCCLIFYPKLGCFFQGSLMNRIFKRTYLFKTCFLILFFLHTTIMYKYFNWNISLFYFTVMKMYYCAYVLNCHENNVQKS